jgi:hypothetical protein
LNEEQVGYCHVSLSRLSELLWRTWKVLYLFSGCPLLRYVNWRAFSWAWGQCWSKIALTSLPRWTALRVCLLGGGAVSSSGT